MPAEGDVVPEDEGSGREASARTAAERLLRDKELDVESLELVVRQLAERKTDSLLSFKRPERVQEIQELCIAFWDKQKFEVGDVVRWKAGLKNKLLLSYDEPAVVWQIVDPPRFDLDESAGSQYFCESLDLVLGFFLTKDDNEERLVTYHYDSRRMEHHPDFAEAKRRSRKSPAPS